jgi:hypothetical protein
MNGSNRGTNKSQINGSENSSGNSFVEPADKILEM